jgi:hypothetical protein
LSRIVTANAGSRIPAVWNEEAPPPAPRRHFPHWSGKSSQDKGFRPWLFTYFGQPLTRLADVRNDCFPSVEVVRIIDDAIPELGSSQRSELSPSEICETLKTLLDSLLCVPTTDASIDAADTRKPCGLRYVREHGESPWVSSALRATTSQGVKVELKMATSVEEDDDDIIDRWNARNVFNIIAGTIPVGRDSWSKHPRLT